MIYLEKRYYHYHNGNLIRKTIVPLTDQEFEEFKKCHESCGDNCWYGSSDHSGYDEDKYDCDYSLMEVE